MLTELKQIAAIVVLVVLGALLFALYELAQSPDVIEFCLPILVVLIGLPVVVWIAKTILAELRDVIGWLQDRKMLVDAHQVNMAKAQLDLSLVQPDSNGLLPVARQLLESGALTNQILMLAAQHVTNHQPVQPVPNTITYSPHMAYRNDVNAIGQEAQTPLPSLVTQDFWQLYSAGALPSNGFLLGYSLEDGQPVTADWKQLYSALIGGASGSGKSTLIRNILAQSALQGGRFVVLDPHFGAGEESLGASLMPLRPLMLCDVASNDKEMSSALQYVATIGKRRLSGQDTDKSPVVLVVDETTALLQRSNVADELTEVLGTISQETRKAGVFALCIGQQFHGEVMDTTVRNSFVSMIATRSRRDVARTMSGNTEFAKHAETLTIGQAVWMQPDGTVTKIAVPNTTQQHVWMVAQALDAQTSPKTGAALLPSTPEISLPNDDNFIDVEGNGKATGRQTEGKILGDATEVRIVDLFLAGSDMQEIVQTVFNINSNGGRQYIEKRNFVQDVLRKYWKSDRGA
ncbi:MAG: type IV secretory system conjugative DNA transfer family protein [Caldilineaceae bacterium]